MIRIVTGLAALALLIGMPLHQAAAQNNTLGGALLGAGVGAIVGGAATGKAGGAVAGGVIGAAAGAILGSQLEPRRGGYYWYKGKCYLRWRDGSYHRTSSKHCY